MRIIILVVLLLFNFVSASAVNWTFIDRGEKGMVYIDSDSIKVDDFSHKVDEEKPVIISADFKFEPEADKDHYLIIKDKYYSTGWRETEKSTVYHKGTGKLVAETADKNGPQKIPNGTIGEKIFNNLFSQYYKNKENHQIEVTKKESQGNNIKSDDEGITIGTMLIYLGMIGIAELIFYLFFKNSKFTFKYRLSLYIFILSFINFIVAKNTPYPVHKGSDGHYIAETVGYILGGAIVPSIIFSLSFFIFNRIKKNREKVE